MTGAVGSRTGLDEAFSGEELDRAVWSPYYLPHWSSRAGSLATYSVHDGELRLSISVDQPLWCPGVHEPPLRVSGVQTGAFAGPVGSTIGQQPFRPDLRVMEEQAPFWGYTPLYGDIEVRMRGEVSPRSMFAFWMSGIEDIPERSGEICVAEIFGSGLGPGSAEVGLGLREFRDPALTGDFTTHVVEVDVAEFHVYRVRWAPGRLAFAIDDEPVRTIDQAPAYPMQLMIAVFDFPSHARAADFETHVPRLVVSHVRGRSLG